MSAPTDALTQSEERIALRVAELLAGAAAEPELLTAEAVAAMLSMSRDWVYRHANELGAIPLGDGAKPALRFRRADVLEAVTARSSGEQSHPSRTPRTSQKRRPSAALDRASKRRLPAKRGRKGAIR